eukprot:8586056-Ditylum_brightwellii.AAC.1
MALEDIIHKELLPALLDADSIDNSVVPLFSLQVERSWQVHGGRKDRGQKNKALQYNAVLEQVTSRLSPVVACAIQFDQECGK